MKNLIISLIILLCLQSCKQTPEEVKIKTVEYYSTIINDTLTLNDGHLYYIIKSLFCLSLNLYYLKYISYKNLFFIYTKYFLLIF
jgi:hypothetical protein